MKPFEDVESNVRSLSWMRPFGLLCAVLLSLLGCSHLSGNPTGDDTATVVAVDEEIADKGQKELEGHSAVAFQARRQDADDANEWQENLPPSVAAPPFAEPTPMATLPPKTTNRLPPASQAVPPPLESVQDQLDEALALCESAQIFWQKGELESALEVLDKAYALILTVQEDDPAAMVQQKEDLRFLISKRILEIYASRHIVVNGYHKAIPREVNRTVQKEIDILTSGGERRFFIQSYKRSGKYRPMILKKLKEAGLPEELSWLPLIESGFKVKALSRARALGLWQFIPSTGYKFGLKRDQYVDERIDFEKSTDAAIAYLKELHHIFGDWSTVLAAYNCGEGRVLRVIRTQNVNYLDDFWDLYGRLPLETARYVPKFLAALHIIENLETYDLADLTPDPPLEYETVEVNRQVHLKNLAAAVETPFDQLRDLNPELRYNLLPPKPYPVRVPAGKKPMLMASIDQVPLAAPPRNEFVYHRIRRGESLSTIARRYRTSVKKIMWANNLRRSSYIVAGKKLKIPLRGTVVSPASSSAAAQRAWNGRHVVKSGDSLWILAKRYHTTTRRIQEVNGLTSTRLIIDQVLKVPSGKEGVPNLAMGSGRYRVKSGDSPYIIARKHGMSLHHFLKINNLTPNSTIYPGQSVRVE